jgi:putative transposase
LLLGFKTELKINSSQRVLLSQHAGVARHGWNWGNRLCLDILAHNQNNPKDKIKFPTAIDLHKWLIALVKPENQWYYESSKCAPQYALRHLSNAWKDCFNKKKGRPKFKKKGRHDSFTLDGSIYIEHFKIQVPKIGWLKTYERLPQGMIPKSVTISRQADRWFVSFKIETEPKPTLKIVDVVGVDLGIKNLATLSTGEIFEGAKSYRKLSKKLAKLQKVVSRRELKSNNWYKGQSIVARLHKRIADIRKDTLHKLTTYLSKNHGQIIVF